MSNTPRSQAGRLICVLVAAWLIDCGGKSDKSPATPTDPSANRVVSIAISGVPAGSLVPGSSFQLVGTATYANGSSQDASSTIAWSSSNPAVIAVTPSGRATAGAPGDADVIASLSGVVSRQGVQVRAADQSDGAFRVAILTVSAKPPPAVDVDRVFARANDMLFLKTGARMTVVDRATGSSNPSSAATLYINAHPADPPDGVLVLSDDATATEFGGYSVSLPHPTTATANRYPSPYVGSNRTYIAVIDFFHKYSRCGYNSQGDHVSNVSFGGECRNVSGLQCVLRSDGAYWVCPGSPSDLYADQDYFIGSSIVHEFMHPFGPAGNGDHYGTPTCTARTGMSAADQANLVLFQQNYGMCPDVYPNFKRR